MKKVVVLGAGAWGTAIATVLASNQHKVVIWSHEEDVVQSISHEHINKRYLPGIQLNRTIQSTIDIAQAVEDAEWIFEAIPVKYMRSVLEKVKLYYSPLQRWIVLSKGIEQQSLFLPTQILNDVFGNSVQSVVVVGPSFAKDVVEKQLTAVNCASESKELIDASRQLMTNSYFKLFPSNDILGLQWCAALKNVIAMGVGILEGAEFTDTTKAFFLVKAFAEMKIFIVAMGGKSETMNDLAGI